jgi:hypothetical protein
MCGNVKVMTPPEKAIKSENIAYVSHVVTYTLFPRCRFAQCKAVAVVEVHWAERHPEVHIEDEVVMQDIALTGASSTAPLAE